MEDDDPTFYHREAMGAFAHEVRTPLTALRMVMEIARREGEPPGRIELDADLAGMLDSSLDDLQGLVDDLQEMSRLERGKLTPGRGPSDLGAMIETAGRLARGAAIETAGAEAVEGPWDATYLARAIAGFAESANRMGDGSGGVSVAVELGEGLAQVSFVSGEPGGEPRPLAADAGFAFFRSWQFVLAMGGVVEVDRRGGYTCIMVTLPLTRDEDA